MTSANLLLNQLQTALKLHGTGYGYRELQAALKDCREAGYTISCKLNSAGPTLRNEVRFIVDNWAKLAPQPKAAKVKKERTNVKRTAAETLLAEIGATVTADKVKTLYDALAGKGYTWDTKAKSWGVKPPAQPKRRPISDKAKKCWDALFVIADIEALGYNLEKPTAMYKHIEAIGWRWNSKTQQWKNKATGECTK